MPEITVFEEIDWTTTPILHPGMDYHEGKAFFTVPLIRNVVKPGKGKDADPVHTKELQTFVVTSDKEGFWYDEEDLSAWHFAPSAQVFQETTPRWSRESTRDFLNGAVSPPSTKDMFDEVRSIYTTYVEYADEVFFDIMALFVLYTYTFRLFESTGYIHFNGTMASGKSRNLSILDALSFNAIWASNMSAASLYRKLAGSPGTTCIDESEGFEGERGEDLRRILNAGYKRGATVTRTEKNSQDRFMPVEYDVFGPKALASINPLDPVIGSRCLVVAMRPSIRELPEFLNLDPHWDEVRDRLYLWAIAHTSAVDTLAKEWRTSKKARLAPRLIGRQWETSSQFVILADFVGGEDFAKTIITFLNGYFATQQEALNATDRLRTTLRCLPRVLAQKAPHPGNLYSLKDIHEVVSSYMETDATEYFKTKHASKNLDTIGFKHKVRGAGGLRVELDEDAVRREFRQRRVEPFPEDTDWLAGKTSYQNAKPTAEPWWTNDYDGPDPEALLDG